MNATETARICDAISRIKPAQRFDEDTPAFWSLVLADIKYADARQAVINLARVKGFIDTSDLIAEVKRIRDKRLAGVDRLAHLAETPAEWRQIIAQVADGELQVPPMAFEDPEAMGRIDASIRDLLQRPPRPLPGDYANPKAIEPPREIPAGEVERVEAERARQLSALEARIATESAIDNTRETS